MSSMKPLAERMRPKTLSEMIGQSHLLARGGILYNLVQSGHLPSLILWGPPGSGKTSLAKILASELHRTLFSLSAISSGVKELREVFEKVNKTGLFSDGTPILFIDEIHRFSKSQQDSLLPEVEKGTVTLIGATTENPSFEVISPLLSRCQVYLLKPMSPAELEELLDRAVFSDPILKTKQIEIAEKSALLEFSGGDGRKLLNNLELVTAHVEKTSNTPGRIIITNENVESALHQTHVRYDKNGEEHYNIISAFIKSMRGSDPNAAVYWLARMIEGGEKPEFIARRMVILASEDIGLANPNAFLIAMACLDAVHKIGWPESRIILSQAAIYLAVSAKSNSCYTAINSAQEAVKRTGNLPVPLHLRNAVTSLMKDLEYGENYKYAHDHENSFTIQDYLPEPLASSLYYKPGNNAREAEVKNYLKTLWKNHYKYET